MLEDKRDRTLSKVGAWDYLEKAGWELVTVVIDEDGQHVAYLRRPVVG